jgi:hypothetical protein
MISILYVIYLVRGLDPALLDIPLSQTIEEAHILKTKIAQFPETKINLRNY